MVGTLYTPKPADYASSTTGKFPAIIFNHGSEEDFADNHLCQIADYYVPQGYIVFIPFRRGDGNDTNPDRRSTGIHINDFVDDFLATSSPYRHPTTCGSSGPVGADACYRGELLRQQADQEIREAMDYLKARPDVAKKGGDSGDYRIAIFGSSYGGQVTVYANTLDLGQSAAVIFSPAAKEWGTDDCSPSEIACGSYTRQSLMRGAAYAHKPAFYLQSRWDVNTRPTMNLPYAHGMSSTDPSHARPFRSAIFNWTGGWCSGGTDCSPYDFDRIHGSFCVKTSVWGQEVRPFLEQYDVR
jgi:dienelactone hydrolase